MANVMIFVPAYGNNVSSHTLMSISQLQIEMITRGIGVGVSALSRPDIEELRNIALSVWFDQYPQFSHLLMVDSDMGFPPNMVVDMLAFGEEIVGAIYRHKTDNVSFVYSGLGENVTGEVRGPFVEVEAVGGGVLLIARTAVDKMVQALPDIVDNRLARLAGVDADKQMLGQKRLIRAFDKLTDPEFGKVSEDISFCRRWRSSGGRVWGAAGYDVQHVGLKVYEGNFKQWTLENHGMSITPGSVAPAPVHPRAEVYETVVAKHGQFEFIKHDTFIGRSLREYGQWCEFELDLLLPLIPEGGVVYDVGANIGTHAIPFAKKVGTKGIVRAFEPQPLLLDLLARNMRSNMLPAEVYLSSAVIGHVDNQTVQLAALPDFSTASNFGAFPALGEGGGEAIMMTLDDLLGTDHRVDLIKIDVEGMEAQVIGGAEKLIKKHKPILYVENNGEDSSPVAEALIRLGYVAWWSIGPYFSPQNHFGNLINVWPNVVPSANLICIPAAETYRYSFADLEPLEGRTDNWRKAMQRRSDSRTR